MEFGLGTPVYTHDLQRIGKINRLVVQDPAAAVHALVVHKGELLPRDLLIATHLVERVDDDGIWLNIDEDAVHTLPVFLEQEYSIPAGTPAGFLMSGLTYPAGFDPAAVPNVVGEETNLQPGEQDIAHGYSVICEDGEVGIVHDILVDGDNERIDALLVETGGDSGVVQIPASQIERVDDQTVILRGTVREILAGPSAG